MYSLWYSLEGYHQDTSNEYHSFQCQLHNIFFFMEELEKISWADLEGGGGTGGSDPLQKITKNIGFL